MRGVEDWRVSLGVLLTVSNNGFEGLIIRLILQRLILSHWTPPGWVYRGSHGDL